MSEKINPQMIALAKISRGLTGTELADKLGVSRTAIFYWENGTTEITRPLLMALAQTLNYPVSFFYQAGEILPLPMSVRQRKKVKKVLSIQIDANANIYRLNMEKLMGAIGQPKHDLPVLDVNEYGTPAECAKQLRKLWNVNPGAIDNLSELLEAHGILLLPSDFGTDRIDGRCLYAADAYPTIITNKSLLGDRQRFTLAYHLGYLVMHLKTSRSLGRDLPKEASTFAAEFLMPEKDIYADLTDLQFEKLEKLKPKWKVSMISLVYRAEDIGLITATQKRYIVEQFNDKKIRKREPKQLDIPIENFKLVRDLLTKYKQKQKFTVSQLAEFFNLKEDDFLQRYNFKQ